MKSITSNCIYMFSTYKLTSNKHCNQGYYIDAKLIHPELPLYECQSFLIFRLRLYDLVEHKVQGDGNCQVHFLFYINRNYFVHTVHASSTCDPSHLDIVIVDCWISLPIGLCSMLWWFLLICRSTVCFPIYFLYIHLLLLFF